MKRALIIGVGGQDGYYLADLLIRNGYLVHGVCRSISAICFKQRNSLTGVAEIELPGTRALLKYVKETIPDEVYYLAAHHFSSQGEKNRKGLMSPFISINLTAPNSILELLCRDFPACKFFYAASSHIFGMPSESPQTEETPFNPTTPYAISKTAMLYTCRYYRETHGLFTVVGILYNHESPRRPASFVTTQIARLAAMAACGRGERLVLRDLNSVVDWGSAEDYVQAMWYTLQRPCGGEYVIATGIPRTVRDFAREAFSIVGLNSEEFVVQQSEVLPAKHKPYVGDSAKIARICGWQPVKTFESLVKEMVEGQLCLLKQPKVLSSAAE